MRTIAHISDVHFGREDSELVDRLVRSIEEAHPDVIVVSGDLTQRAKKRQFRAARAFLNDLPDTPRIVVPGNHDVSTTNLVERAVRPLARYQRFITKDLSPFYADHEVAIAGINTVRVLSTKDGRINAKQVNAACAQLDSANPDALRVVVTHHPMDLPAEDLRHALVVRSRMAIDEFARARVDLFLSGHLHAGLSLSTVERYPEISYRAVVVHAGTAVSTRTRGEANAWNLIRLDRSRIEVQQMAWEGERFLPCRMERYGATETGWERLKT